MMRHSLHRLTAAQKIARHVGSKHLVDTLRGQILRHALGKQNARVIDQRAERLVLLVNRPEHRHHLLLVTDVGLNGKCATAAGRDPRHYLLRRRGVMQIIHRHGVALRAQQERRRFANAAARAGDKCNGHTSLLFIVWDTESLQYLTHPRDTGTLYQSGSVAIKAGSA